MKFFGAILLGLLLGVVGTLGGYPLFRTACGYFGPPRVTLLNASGEDISAVAVILGNVRQQMPDLKNGHGRTVKVSGRFSECSTRISWTDSMGEHEENAGDYMESCGFYHSTVVLTADRKARAIYGIKD